MRQHVPKEACEELSVERRAEVEFGPVSESADSSRPNPDENLSGLIERVTFHNTETGFGVLQVKVRGMKNFVTVLGTLPKDTVGRSRLMRSRR